MFPVFTYTMTMEEKYLVRFLLWASATSWADRAELVRRVKPRAQVFNNLNIFTSTQGASWHKRNTHNLGQNWQSISTTN